MRIFDHLLATSMDSLSMVKKADQLVIKHQQKMQTAESNLKSAEDLLTTREWKLVLSGLEGTPSRAPLQAHKDEDDGNRSRDKNAHSKPKVAFAAVGPPSTPSPATSSPATPAGPVHQIPAANADRTASRYSGQSPERPPRSTGPPRRSASPAVMAPPKTGNNSAREAGRTSEARLLGGTTCWNCGEQGHYSTNCPKPQKPRPDTPPNNRYDKSRTSHPGGQLTANVANAVKPESEKRVEFSTGGADYWTASVAVRGTDSKWIRKEREYLIRMKFLVLDIPQVRSFRSMAT
jgi:hypothetical protein